MGGTGRALMGKSRVSVRRDISMLIENHLGEMSNNRLFDNWCILLLAC